MGEENIHLLSDFSEKAEKLYPLSLSIHFRFHFLMEEHLVAILR